MQRGDYGYDAPYALIVFALAAVATAIGAGIFLWQGMPHGAKVMAVYCLFFAANAAFFWHTTRRGKFIEWEGILDSLKLRGDETVLDIGCGRGAVLTAVARRLRT